MSLRLTMWTRNNDDSLSIYLMVEPSKPKRCRKFWRLAMAAARNGFVYAIDADTGGKPFDGTTQCRRRVWSNM